MQPRFSKCNEDAIRRGAVIADSQRLGLDQQGIPHLDQAKQRPLELQELASIAKLTKKRKLVKRAVQDVLCADKGAGEAVR